MDVSQFNASVERYVAIDESLETIANSTKAMKREQGELSKRIMTYMQEQGSAKVETDKVNLRLASSVAQKSLTMDLLSQVFKERFPAKPKLCSALIEDIQAARKCDAGTRTRLKRIKRRV